jgi:hypothetical protein
VVVVEIQHLQDALQPSAAVRVVVNSLMEIPHNLVMVVAAVQVVETVSKVGMEILELLVKVMLVAMLKALAVAAQVKKDLQQ